MRVFLALSGIRWMDCLGWLNNYNKIKISKLFDERGVRLFGYKI